MCDRPHVVGKSNSLGTTLVAISGGLTMQRDDDITDLVRAADAKSVPEVVAEIKAAYAVSETAAYAIFVRVAAGCPGEQEDQRADVVGLAAHRLAG